LAWGHCASGTAEAGSTRGKHIGKPVPAVIVGLASSTANRRAIQAVAAVLLMVDPRDLGLVAQVRSPHQESPTIYLYEAMPGGVGLSERLWTRHDELVAGAAELVAACSCESGCPACTGPRLDPLVDAKALALRLLRALGAADRAITGRPSMAPSPAAVAGTAA
jgi:hypothetical protein